MLKYPITYEDFDGNEVTEEFFFNITESELIELEVEKEEGMYAWLQNIVKSENRQQMVKEFKRIILLAYGEKSPDGKKFVKNDEIREGFSQTAAYNALFMKLTTEEEASANFIKGILPSKLMAQAEKAELEAVPAPEPTPDTNQ